MLPYTYESAASLTLSEAQAAGTAVITTGTKGLREVAGEAAIFMPEASPKCVADAMAEINSDPDKVARLVADGVANAARLSWQRSSEELLNILHRAASVGRNRA